MGNNLTPRVLLIRAAARVRRGWTRNTNALDEQGRPVDSYSPRAVKWCAVGALIAENGDCFSHAFQDAYDALRLAVGENPSHFNDNVAKDAEDVAKAMLGAAAWVDEEPDPQ